MFRLVKNIYHYCQGILAIVLYGYPARKLQIIGVTGTDGKTTTSTMLYQILRKANASVGLIGTLGVTINDEHQTIGLHVTTPSPFTLQKLLRLMVKKGCAYAIIEATSHGLDQNRLVGCNFQYGLITNLTHEHLDYHKTMSHYAKAKAKLFRKLKVSVLNKDDTWYETFAQKASGKVITYSLRGNGDVTPQNMPFTLKIPGDYNKTNGLAAAALAKGMGIPDETILAALQGFEGVEGRLEKIALDQPFDVIVDFAHTPNALKEVLTTIRNETVGNVIVVFGSAGLRDSLKRPITGETAASLADISIVTADDPATEDVNDIIEQISQGCKKANALEVTGLDLVARAGNKVKQHVFTRIPDRKQAIELALRIAREGDTVALLGKGHQKSLSIGKEEIPWDEKQISIDALKELGFHE